MTADKSDEIEVGLYLDFVPKPTFTRRNFTKNHAYICLIGDIRVQQNTKLP
jgi:hypothetical protein